MVLTQRRWLAPLVVLCFPLLASCLSKPDTMRLDQPAGVTAAYLVTFPDRPEVEAAPQAVVTAANEALGKRNLQARPAPFPTLAETFERKRSTEDRLAALAAQSSEPFVLLVEAQPRYYSLINGRYRWNVTLKATFAPREALSEAETQEWDLAAFLDFDHQDHVEAMEYSSTVIADRLGRLADQFLSGLDSGGVTRPTAKKKASASLSASPLDPGGSIYFVMVDRFHNGDPSNDGDVDPSDPHAFHGGDLQGLSAKLDWLKDLGVTTIWLSPVFEMRDEKFHGHGAFHGYWVEDFGTIEDRFGGGEALVALREAAAERGISIMLDVVLNHVSFDAPLVTEKPDWFHNKGGITNWQDREQVVTHDVHGLPDLAQENPEVYEHLLRHSLHWIEVLRPAGFRLDAVKHVSDEFWQQYNADIKRAAGADFVLLGEDLDGDPAKVARTMRNGNFDAMFDFPLHFAMVDVFCRDAHPGRLASILYADRLYPAAVGERREGLVTLLDNHDLPRILSVCGDDTERVEDAMAFMMSARGTPSLTWGTESGAAGMAEPANRADMRFTAHPLGDTLRAWLDRRAAQQVFTHGDDRLLALNDQIFAYLRIDGEDAALVTVNRGEPTKLAVAGSWTNVETNATASDEVTVPRGTSVWTGKALAAPAARGEVALQFEVTGAPVGEVRIVGSGPELGDWDPARAPVATDVKLPAGGAFAYKVVVMGAEGPMWLDGDNEYLLVDEPRTVTVGWR